MGADGLVVERVPVGSLVLHPKNARQGDVGLIAESLREHGQYRPLVVQRATRHVLAGNHTLQAAASLGWESVEVVFLDVDDDEALRVLLVDNRSSDQASYDEPALAELLSDLAGRSERMLAGTGWDRDDLDRLLAGVAGFDATPGRDAEPAAPPENPVSRPGDLWVLGEHRLLCGDARSDLPTLTGADQADLLWTDPPYGVEYEGKTSEAMTFSNDDAAGLPALLAAVFGAADAALRPGAALYVAHPAGGRGVDFIEAFVVHWPLRQMLVWVKDSMVLGHSGYHYKHEGVLYGYKPTTGRLGRGGAGWFGDNSQTSVFDIERPKRSEEHPTMKPVALVESCLRNSSRPGDLILDPFAGSGTTMVAAENLGRRARLCEVDPGYCDVICRRWQDLSGEKPERDGKPHDFSG